jgi:hypothetical protein
LFVFGKSKGKPISASLFLCAPGMVRVSSDILTAIVSFIKVQTQNHCWQSGASLTVERMVRGTVESIDVLIGHTQILEVGEI